MKPKIMTADEFRSELKRLKLGQSAFAEAAEIPLRTVQSWAIGERKIPATARAVIEKVEQLPLSHKIAAMVLTHPDKETRKAISDLIRLMADQNKKTKELAAEIKKLTAETNELKSSQSMLEAKLRDVRQTCVFQAQKIEAYARDDQLRAANVRPFNI
jgi:septal ring factor EnvC (AmiA/AmiB activator)